MNSDGVYDFYLHEKDCDIGEIKRKILDAVSDDHKDDFERFYPSPADLNYLPRNSVLIRLQFTLKKPYTSRGEDAFSTNPIVRDKFTCLPIVRPSTWKGNLRFAANMVDNQNNQKRMIIRRLFGSGSHENNGFRGRLHFFPTFFETTKDDVITPVNRKTRKPSRGPIEVEVIGAGTKGMFHILYTPYPRGRAFKRGEIHADLQFLVEAMKLMFHRFGFSARRTSGFGVVKEDLEGELWLADEFHEFQSLTQLRNIIGGMLR